MHVRRTPTIDVNMTTFFEFHKSLLNFANLFEDTHLKIEENLDSNIIKIFGEKITSLSRAKNGLDDVIELAFATAEHHPYWNLLYQCSQISKTILEKWEDELSKEEFEEIEWSIKELEHTFEKLKTQSA